MNRSKMKMSALSSQYTIEFSWYLSKNYKMENTLEDVSWISNSGGGKKLKTHEVFLIFKTTLN